MHALKTVGPGSDVVSDLVLGIQEEVRVCRGGLRGGFHEPSVVHGHGFGRVLFPEFGPVSVNHRPESICAEGQTTVGLERDALGLGQFDYEVSGQ